MSPKIEKKRVDWGTVKSKSGRIDASLSSYPPSSGMTPRSTGSERRISCDHSISEIDEIDEIEAKPVVKEKGDDMAESGHDTDKTQAMQISSRTLDDFETEYVNEEGRKREVEDEDSFGENDVADKPRRGLSRTLSRGLSMEDIYKPSKVRCLRLRRVCGKLVNHPKFQLFIILLILVNSLMMGIGTFDFVTENPEVSAVFEKIDMAFLIVFTVEISLQLVYRGYKLFMDGWLLFDFTVVLISWSLSSLQIIRAFRVFRALRLITRIETLRKLVTALMDVLPKMTAIGALLSLVFYIFAVMFTVLFKDLYEQGLTEEDYFSSLTVTLFTLTQMMTMDWAGVARQCMLVYPWAWAPIVAFVGISGFVVFNLIIAVVCDAVSTVEQESEDMAEKSPDADSVSADSTSEAESDDDERVRELRSRVDLLLRNQLEMQGLIQRIVEDMKGEKSCEDDVRLPSDKKAVIQAQPTKMGSFDELKDPSCTDVSHDDVPAT